MFTEQLAVLLIIAVVGSHACPEGGIYIKKCWEVVVVPCEDRNLTSFWNCNGTCLCEDKWSVRDNKKVCIPVWKCSGICPRNAVFHSCANDYQSYLKLGQVKAAAREFKKLCKPKCACKKGYEMNFHGTACLPRKVQLATIHEFLHFG